MIIILEIYILIWLHARDLPRVFKESMSFIVELQEELNNKEKESFKSRLINYPLIDKSSISYIDKGKALKMMAEESSSTELAVENPFRDMFVFNLHHEDYSEKNANNLQTELELDERVLAVYHSGGNYKDLIGNVSKLNWILFVVIILLIILVLSILFGSIRLLLNDNRFNIKTMELVGARAGYIEKLYQKQSFNFFLKAFLAANVILVLLLLWFYLKSDTLMSFFKISYLLLSVLLAGLLAYIILYITTKLEVNRYLSKHFYELYKS